MKFFCCCRRINTTKKIKLTDLQFNTLKSKDIISNNKDNKDSSSIEINQSQSLDSNNLNNSTKDDILKTNKLNIIPKNITGSGDKKNDNLVKCNNAIYNIIKMDNINNINNKNKIYLEKEKELNNKDKILSVKENELKTKDNELSEREKKLFEKENELSNKEKEINNKIMELFQRTKKINNENGNGSKQMQKKNVINDVIKYKNINANYNKGNGNNINNSNNYQKGKKVEKKNMEIII